MGRSLRDCEAWVHVVELEERPSRRSISRRRIELVISDNEKERYPAVLHLSVAEAAKLGGALISAAGMACGLDWDDGVEVISIGTVFEDAHDH